MHGCQLFNILTNSATMLILGIETSCDETGVALYDSAQGLRAHALHSQAADFAAYGGVVPELASRDHIRRVLPLVDQVLTQLSLPRQAIDAIAYTAGPGLAGALMVGAASAQALGLALNKPLIPIHHLEGHLLSPLLSPQADKDLTFPYLALLVSGGHTQLVAVWRLGHYELLGETIDDAAGEAFDKSAQLLGIPYPGGAGLSQLAQQGDPQRFQLPRPLLHNGTLDFSFSGLKTAVLHRVHKQQAESVEGVLSERDRADIALAFVQAMVAVLVTKTMSALQQTGLTRCAVVGGVSANVQLRAACRARAQVNWFFPDLQFCSDNGAMIALAGALRWQAQRASQVAPSGNAPYQLAVFPRWPLTAINAPSNTDCLLAAC